MNRFMVKLVPARTPLTDPRQIKKLTKLLLEKKHFLTLWFFETSNQGSFVNMIKANEPIEAILN